MNKQVYWKLLNPYHKHISLMYHYRLKTCDLKDLSENYVEVYRYTEFRIKTELLPDFIFKLKPEILIKDAYEAIGKRYDPR